MRHPLASRIAGATLLLLGALMLAFTLLFAAALAKPLAWQADPSASLVSIPLPFALVFLVVGWRLTRLQIGEDRILSAQAWARLGFLLLVSGGLMAILLHWFAIVLPGIIGALCLLGHPKSEKLLLVWPF